MHIDALNDSQLIGNCVYNVLILSSLGLTLTFVLKDQVHIVAGLISGFLLFGTFVTEMIIFIPKVKLSSAILFFLSSAVI